MKEVLFDLIGIGCAVALLVHFVMIAFFGALLVQEPNKYILSFEIAMCLFIIGLGIDRAIKDMRE